MNERDSEALACLLEADGAVPTDSEEDADLIIFNTCSVRDQAERKAVGKIGFMKKIKARKPSLIVGCIGCMAQNHGDQLLKDLPVLDFVAGTDQLHRVPEIVKNIIKTRRRTAETQLDKIIRPELDGLMIDPCIPSSLKSYTVTRRFRGADYRITVDNPDGAETGIREAWVEGKKTELSGNAGPCLTGRGLLLAPAAPGSVVEVKVILGV